MAVFFPSKLLTIILPCLLFTISSSALTPLQSFTQCFLNTTPTSPNLLYTSTSSSYESILQSSAQNPRFLLSSTDRKPAAIVTATAESHVSAAVVCARAHGLHVRTRSGGHDYEAMSYVSEDRQSFVTVDLAALRGVDVDARSRTAWVQAGATLGELYYNVFTATNGTAGFPAGLCPTLGVGGHVSGGGIGLMARKFGTAADNVIDARVMGVDGRVLDREAMGEDLFWAVRGGGAASFGVVLAYRVKLVDVPPVVTAFAVNRNLRQNATKLVTRWLRIAPKFDENLDIIVDAQRTTDNGSPSIQAHFNSLYLGNRSALLTVMAKGFPELGLRPEDCTEMTWLQSVLFSNGISDQGIQALLNRTRQSNSSFKGKSDLVTAPISEDNWESIWNFLIGADQAEQAHLIMEPFGGRMAQISSAATPFPHRHGVLHIIQYFMSWSETSADADQVTQKHLEWMRRLYGFMTPYVSKSPRAAYYNYKDIDLGRNPDRGNAGYAAARVWGEKYFKGNFKRLALVKGRVDPENFFRNEQSIPPLLAQ